MITELINFFSLFPPFLKMRRLYFMHKGFNEPMWGGGIFKQNIKEAFAKFLSSEELSSEQYKEKLIKDIVNCYLLYGSTPDEYFLFDMLHSDYEKRSSYVTDMDKDKTAIRVTGIDLFKRDLCNKFNFYCKTADFFKRKAILVENVEDRKRFVQMTLECKKVFAKLLEGSYGANAIMFEINSEADALEAFDKLLRTESKWIVEECIIQAKCMAQWNSSSVNTVRIPSFLCGGKSNILGPFFRTGRKGCIIDNAGGGGIFAVLNPDTGVVETDGMNELGKYYVNHPDSGLQYRGFQIPEWDNLLDITRKIHLTMPFHRYIAFDFAYTDQGWVLIEGNWGQLISQYNNKIGLKKKFHQYMGC